MRHANTKTGVQPGPAVSDWRGVTAASLHKRDLDALLADELAYLHVPGFFDRSSCERAVKRFSAALKSQAKARSYGDVKTEELGRMFTPVVASPDDYFKEVAALSPRIRAVYRGGDDPLSKLEGLLSSLLGYKRVAVEALKNPLLPDFIWALCPGTSVPIHEDSCRPLCAKFEIHLSWNLYLSVPESGGASTVYRRRIKAADERFRTTEFYGYSPDLVKGCPKAVFQPAVGDLLLFNSANYHAVGEVGPGPRRIAGHGFIAISPSRGEFGFWI